MNPNNPFVVRGYSGAAYFCDRVQETARLLSSLQNDSDVTLIAPRRFGKTGLIHHAFAKLPKDWATIYLDIYSVKDLASFTRVFAAAVMRALDTKIESAMKAAAQFFRSCRPTVVPQADGMPKFSFDVVQDNAEATLKEVFDYLAAKDRPIVIAIDEFQQVAKFPESGVEALLRSYIQFVPHVRFVFAGSHKHMMEQMFASPSRPFYQSTDFLSLHEIPSEKYAKFAARFFHKAGRDFDPEVFDRLYRRFDGITWYVQAGLNRIWRSGNGLVDDVQIDAAVDDLLLDREDLYLDLLRVMNEGSRQLLIAIGQEGVVKEPTAGTFVTNHRLKAASSVQFALNDLKARDLVYETPEGWVVYDRLFGVWIAREYRR